MTYNSWGNYPIINKDIVQINDQQDSRVALKKDIECIAFGNGRSYGDSALNHTILALNNYDKINSFDQETGLLHLQSGVLLSTIIQQYSSQGWFLPVTPGTKFITVGRAIASDIHGKAHHVTGCFSQSIISFSLMLPNGDVVICSHSENKALFLATCGGMGLTGIILEVSLQLIKISSLYINQTIIRTKNLEETFNVFEQYHHLPYSVAWLDCLAKNTSLGRSVFMVGEFSDSNVFDYKVPKSLKILFYFPNFSLNKWTVKAFNFLYYHKAKNGRSQLFLEPFFYPLDSILEWNKIYGSAGFTQYQFVLPKACSFDGLSRILNTISASKFAPFLVVLKLCGKANDNYLSFPIEGYTLALDFRIQPGLFEFLDELDQLVLQYKGRFYLAKDVRVSKDTFEQGYPNIDLFRAIRKEYKCDTIFQSLQSRRLQL